MRNLIVHRFLIRCAVLLVAMFLIASCAQYTKVAISKNFDKKKTQITVIPFANSGLKDGSDNFISDKLAFILTSKGFNIIEREIFQNVISELQLEPSGMLRKGDLSKIGKHSSIDIICYGSVYYSSSHRGHIFPYTITVRFVDVASSEVVFLAECTNEKDWDGSYCLNEISNKLIKDGQ